MNDIIINISRMSSKQQIGQRQLKLNYIKKNCFKSCSYFTSLLLLFKECKNPESSLDNNLKGLVF